MTLRTRSAFAAVALSALVAGQVSAAELRTTDNGFYGGISLRTTGSDGTGLTFGHLGNEWSRFSLPTADDTAARTLMFGGYRWRNDFAVEAALATSERYALQRTDALGRSGVGLALPGLAQDAPTRSWNVDVYGSWAFWRTFSLYGRLGYVQPDVGTLPVDVRRNREGVNYGLGLRYDMSRSLGLKLEYARFGHLFGDAVGSSLLPESDQVQFGVQYRF